MTSLTRSSHGRIHAYSPARRLCRPVRTSVPRPRLCPSVSPSPRKRPCRAKQLGITIRVSGVRVPPPASPNTARSAPRAKSARIRSASAETPGRGFRADYARALDQAMVARRRPRAGQRSTRARTSSPREDISPISQRNSSQRRSGGPSSAGTENPPACSPRACCRRRPTRSSAASCSDAPSPCTHAPRQSLQRPARSRTCNGGVHPWATLAVSPRGVDAKPNYCRAIAILRRSSAVT
jgi:hypothetical protein